MAARPLPNYLVGRKRGPAEFANLAERGPELVGQPATGFRLVERPSVGYLRAGDSVLPAPKTHQLLQGIERVTTIRQFRHEQQDMQGQAGRIRALVAEQRAARLAVQRKLLHEMRQVRKAIDEQGYQCWDELGQAMKRIQKGLNRRDEYISRYKRQPPDYMDFLTVSHHWRSLTACQKSTGI